MSEITTQERQKYKFIIDAKFPVKLRCGTLIHLLEYIDSETVIVHDLEGNVKTVRASTVRNNAVSWRSFGTQLPKAVQIGDIFESPKWGKYEIVAYSVDTYDVTVKWLATGNIQENCDIYRARDGLLIDKQKQECAYCEFLGIDTSKHYVYIITLNEEVLYVGKGVKKRYRHVFSGKSHVVGLNMLHFQGTAVQLSVLASGLTHEEALAEEKRFIRQYRPKFNRYCM